MSCTVQQATVWNNNLGKTKRGTFREIDASTAENENNNNQQNEEADEQFDEGPAVLYDIDEAVQADIEDDAVQQENQQVEDVDYEAYFSGGEKKVPQNNEDLMKEIFGVDSDSEEEDNQQQQHGVQPEVNQQQQQGVQPDLEEEVDQQQQQGVQPQVNQQQQQGVQPEAEIPPDGIRRYPQRENRRPPQKFTNFTTIARLRLKYTDRQYYADQFFDKRFGLNVTVNEGIKKLGAEAVLAVVKEMAQMIDPNKTVLEGVKAEDLSPEDLKRLITSHVFLKEKFNAAGFFEKLKARLVAGGHLQDRTVYNKASSPTVSTSAVFIVSTIAAAERRAVAVIDFPGAFLNSLMPQDRPQVYMKLNKYLTNVLVHLDNTFKQFIRKDGTSIVRLNRALYGCIESARLWYEQLTAFLEDKGFVRNKYDMCVFNRTDEGHQTTLCIHVDDMKITAFSEKCIDALTEDILSVYPELTVHRGRVHNYLRMIFDYTQPGKCKVTMQGYVDDILKEYACIEGVEEVPAGTNLFKIDSKAKRLNEALSEEFHSLTAKLQYLGKRVRPDILTSISFLAKRVKEPTEQDERKLHKVVRYVRGTKHLGIVLEGDKNLSVLAYVDASYGVHDDFKSHTGVVIGVGRGPVYAKSTGQKLNSKSSTEAELIGLSDATGQIVWTRNFLLEQGYNIEPATVYEDNMSTIALVKNGKSNSERSRHIAIRFFFIADRVASKEIKVEYIKTGDMIADILTKPLSGELFKRLRNKLLNWYE